MAVLHLSVPLHFLLAVLRLPSLPWKLSHLSKEAYQLYFLLCFCHLPRNLASSCHSLILPSNTRVCSSCDSTFRAISHSRISNHTYVRFVQQIQGPCWLHSFSSERRAGDEPEGPSKPAEDLTVPHSAPWCQRVLWRHGILILDCN